MAGPTRNRTMSEAEAESFIISLLKARGPMTTMGVEQLARTEGKHCPDRTVMFLTKMMKKGLICGEVSIERRGWLWSLP